MKITRKVSLKIAFTVCWLMLFGLFMPAVATANGNSTHYKSTAVHHTSKLSLNFENIKVRNLLRSIAKAAQVNFIIDDTVQGTMTLNLENVTWQHALKIVLKANGLTSTRYDDVYIIAPIAVAAEREKQELLAKQTISNLAPLRSTIVRLKYANAGEIAMLLKGKQGRLLSQRGQVSSDARTNSVWVRDTSSVLSEVRRYVSELDVPAKQVLIEAKIVSIRKDYERELGTRFGITSGRRLSGTLDGADQLLNGTTPSGATLGQRLNFDLPATSLFTRPATVGLALATLGGSTQLDLELSALESEGHAKVISSPRLITSNQTKAVIEQGEEIPYQEASSSGATSIAFKKAVLSLSILPQITRNNKVMLQVKVTQDKRGQNVNVLGSPDGGTLVTPAIDTEEIESEVLLNNGETVVIGGIYKKTVDDQIDRVPFLGTLPVIGHLFSHKQKRKIRSELLIFLTPKVINQGNIKTVSMEPHKRYKHQDIPSAHILKKKNTSKHHHYAKNIKKSSKTQRIAKKRPVIAKQAKLNYASLEMKPGFAQLEKLNEKHLASYYQESTSNDLILPSPRGTFNRE